MREAGRKVAAPAGSLLASPTSASTHPPCRQDNDIPLQALVPPLAALPEAAQRTALAEPLLPVDVEGDRQYFLRRARVGGRPAGRGGAAGGRWMGQRLCWAACSR